MDVTLPNGVVVRGVPDGTNKWAIAEKAIANGLARPEDFGQESAHPGKYADPIREAIGLGDAALSLGSGIIAGPVSGLAGIGAGLIPGGMTGADTVRSVADAMTFEPKTAIGQRTLEGISRPFAAFERFADTAGEVTGDPSDTLGATAVKTALLAAPSLLGLRGLRGGTAKPPALVPEPPPVAPSLSLGSGELAEAAQRAVNSAFTRFKETVGTETIVPMTSTIEAINKALTELASRGLKKGSLVQQLRGIVDENPQRMATIGQLDGIHGSLIAQKMAPRNQHAGALIDDVLDASIKDMGAAGKLHGLSFEHDLALARAVGDLYKHDSNLGRFIGRSGEQLKEFRAADPKAYQEIVTDWSKRQLEKSFISTAANGGRYFRAERFKKWVGTEEKWLRRILDDKTVDVWKRFADWSGRATFMKNLSMRLLDVKTGGLSGFFRKDLDSALADEIASGLTDPTSTLYKTLSADPARVRPGLRLPVVGVGGLFVDEEDE